VVDHILPLKRGGADTPANMQCQAATGREGEGQDRVNRDQPADWSELPVLSIVLALICSAINHRTAASLFPGPVPKPLQIGHHRRNRTRTHTDHRTTGPTYHESQEAEGYAEGKKKSRTQSLESLALARVSLTPRAGISTNRN
jgi:hypothetical protein